MFITTSVITTFANTTPAVKVEPGMGCGIGSDGAACSPAYLCPDCIDLLIADSYDAEAYFLDAGGNHKMEYADEFNYG
jgi:hypothetical protein